MTHLTIHVYTHIHAHTYIHTCGLYMILYIDKYAMINQLACAKTERLRFRCSAKGINDRGLKRLDEEKENITANLIQS